MDLHAFNGIVLYDIELNGCLNGVYTNMEAPAGIIYNEIARRRIDPRHAGDEVGGVELEIGGVYDCQYFDIERELRQCQLTITKDKGINAYTFEWKEKGEAPYHGRGYKMNSRQIVVHYGE